MRAEKSLHKLRSQLILTFLVSSLGIGLTIGLPAILIINRQASLQAQRLLEQAALTTRAFLENEQADLQNLGLLISQRPTLIRLLDEKDDIGFPDYFETLGQGSNLDLLLICVGDEEIAMFNRSEPPAGLCAKKPQTGYAVSASGNIFYLYTTVDLELSRQPDDRVIVGKRTSATLSMLQSETGLTYFLIQQNKVVNASDSSLMATSAAELLRHANQPFGASIAQQAIEIHSRRYLVADLPLDPTLGIHLVSALNIDEQIAIQRNLTDSLTLGVVFIVLVASGLGAWQSQRISGPIAKLANAAQKFRQGNLDAPVNAQSSVLEISQLANTLEDARVALQHSVGQLQTEKAWIEHLLNSIVEGTLTLDGKNQITFASVGVGKILETAPDLFVGQRADDIFITAEEEISFSNQLPETGQQATISIRLASGKERLLSVSTAKFLPPIASNANRALVIRDVTNEEYVHRLLGDFMANITHEFRTPLSALGASAELLLDNLPNLNREEIQGLLVSLNLGIINLQTLIDNLIEAASIEAGRFKISTQPVRFEAILQDAKAMTAPLAEKYNLRLDFQSAPGPLVVHADQRRTVQVLVNLVSNAIKHSPEGGCIQVTHKISEGHLLVEVSDEGGGIAAEIRENLFRRFSHLETQAERARQGLGLGLSVVKAIVEAQRGEVGVKSRQPGGATFWFTIPLNETNGETQ
jgi:two-component system, OmpR family, sensor histidine kinase ResE